LGDLVIEDFWWFVIFYKVDLGYLSVFEDCTGFLGIVLDVGVCYALGLFFYFYGLLTNYG